MTTVKQFYLKYTVKKFDVKKRILYATFKEIFKKYNTIM